MAETSKHKRWTFWHKHSLSIVSILVLTLWIILYSCSDPSTHMGAFYGNAIADWSVSVVIILGTKFLLEAGSAESNPVKKHLKNPVVNFLWRHSLLIFLFLTGVGWAVLYFHMKSESRWGQVVGNIVSEWVQMAGLVFFTKKLLEKGSEESK